MAYQPQAQYGGPPPQQQTMAYQPQTYGATQTQTLLVPQPPGVIIMAMPQAHQWKTGLLETCCEAPGAYCYSCCCPHCAIYQQRTRLLAFTGDQYSCCQRASIPRPQTCCSEAYQPPPTFPPSVWPPQEGNLPPILNEFNCELCLEATFCVGCAIGGTRNLMHYKFGVVNSDCDTATICCVIICCAANRHRHDANGGFAALMACMTTQQHIELELEEQKRMSMGIIYQPPTGPLHQSMSSPVEPQKFQQAPPPQYTAGYAQPNGQYQQPQGAPGGPYQAMP